MGIKGGQILENHGADINVKRNNRLKIIWISIGLFILVLLAGYIYASSRGVFKNEDVVSQRTVIVGKEDLSTTITGSGPIISSSRIDVFSKISGTVKSVYFKEGDAVKKGDLICDFDTTDSKAEIEKNQNNLAENQFIQKENMKDAEKLNITAPFNGQITEISIDKGDIIQKNGVVFTIVNSKKMRLTVPFDGSSVSKVKIGDIAEVNIQNLMQSIKGEVRYISDASYSNKSGGDLYNVEIIVNNPGSLTEDTIASAEIETAKGIISSASSSALTYFDKQIVRSDTGGIVKNVFARLYQKVNSGETIVKLQNDEITAEVKTTDLKLKDLKYVLNNSKAHLKELKIYSPIDGLVSKLNAIEGYSFKPGEVVLTIANNKNMEFTVPIDELDIEKVKIGQKVNVSFDALPNTSLNSILGTVSGIAVEGTPQNGITTFPVKISIGNNLRNNINKTVKNNGNKTVANTKVSNKKNAIKSKNMVKTGSSNLNKKQTSNGNNVLNKLRGGMNANAEIIISDKKGILTVPLESIFKISGKSYAMVKSDLKTVEELKKNGKYINVFDTKDRSYSNVNKATVTKNNKNKKAATQKATSVKSNNNNNLKQFEEYFSNCIPTPVEVGINNESMIEIKSGLKLGQEIVLTPVTLGQNNKSQNKNATQGILQIGSGAKK